MSGAQPGVSAPPGGASLRGLLALVSALLFLETVFLTLISPLLPHLQDELGLSTTQAGMLLGMYALGGLLAAVGAVAVTNRYGARAAGAASLLVFALASLGFGLADSYLGLLATRLMQGLAGAACWTAGMVWLLEVAPVSRRGEMIGAAFGVAEAGAIAGPFFGGLAASLGRAEVFGAIAVFCLLLGAVTVRFPAPPTKHEPLRPGAMYRSRRVRAAVLLAMLPAATLATIGVLAPLQQDGLGAGAGEIAITFGLAALAGILVRPLWGRWSDRRGPLLAVRTGMLVNVPVLAVLPWLDSRLGAALLICLALNLVGVLWAPLMVILSDACLAVGAGQAMAVAVMNVTWPPAALLGSVGGAAVAQASSQRLTYGLIAAALLGAFFVLGSRRSPLGPELAVAEAA